jgi:hypothetical protein
MSALSLSPGDLRNGPTSRSPVASGRIALPDILGGLRELRDPDTLEEEDD